MSVFHQIKNLFRSSHNKLATNGNSEQRKAHTKQAAERIVQEENIAKSRLPNYEGLSQYQLLEKLGEYVLRCKNRKLTLTNKTMT